MNKKETYRNARMLRRKFDKMSLHQLEKMIKHNTLKEIADIYSASYSLIQKIIAIRFTEGSLINVRGIEVALPATVSKPIFSEDEDDYGFNSEWIEFKKQFIIIPDGC